jgi:hypothetical protein
MNEGNVIVFQRRWLNKAFRSTGSSYLSTLTTGQKTEVPTVTLCLGQSHIQTACMKFLNASSVSRGCCMTLVFHFQYDKKWIYYYYYYYYYYIFTLTIIILLKVYYKWFVTVFPLCFRLLFVICVYFFFPSSLCTSHYVCFASSY